MSDSSFPFTSHSRVWQDFRYVYPVISRRAHGLSVGINLSPDKACNFNCVYCQVDRDAHAASGKDVDLERLEQELRTTLTSVDDLFERPEFAHVPTAYRRLNDIAFSGDGEPTASPVYPNAVDLVIRVKQSLRLAAPKIVTITNAGFLSRPEVRVALARADAFGGEIWAKLDAGTEDYFRKVNRCSATLDDIVRNITDAARERPLVLQSLFMRIQGVAVDPDEIRAYVGRLEQILAAGGSIRLVQVYTVARRTAVAHVTPAALDELEAVASAIWPLGIPVECYV